MADLSSFATGARDTIGRYFSVVSAVPSALFVVWIFLLVASGAWSGPPDLSRAIYALGESGLGGAVGLVVAAFAFGLVLHPLQYALVQALEGYWGVGPVGRGARRLRARKHRSLVVQLDEEAAELGDEVNRLGEARKSATGADLQHLQTAFVETIGEVRELDRALGIYPIEPEDVMPTRLGNVLRRYERAAGKPYGLDAVTVMPALSRVAATGDMDYVNDQRSQLDLAARMATVSFLAAAFTALFMARHGLWLLLALVPYAAGYLSYRGTIVIAAEYGRALSVVIALNRFALYDRMRLAPPSDLAAEQERNKTLTRVLQNYDEAALRMDYGKPDVDRRTYL